MAEDWIEVAAVDEIAPGTAIKVQMGRKAAAVFNVDGSFYAVQNNCPHRGAPLFNGDIKDTTVICLDHGWNFSLTDGSTPQGPECALMCWDVKVEDGKVFLSRLPRM